MTWSSGAAHNASMRYAPIKMSVKCRTANEPRKARPFLSATPSKLHPRASYRGLHRHAPGPVRHLPGLGKNSLSHPTRNMAIKTLETVCANDKSYSYCLKNCYKFSLEKLYIDISLTELYFIRRTRSHISLIAYLYYQTSVSLSLCVSYIRYR